MKSDIQAVFLDFGNVLVSFKDRVAVLEEIAEAHKGSPHRLRQFLTNGKEYSVQRQNTPFLERVDRGEFNKFQFCKKICEEGDFDLDMDQFETMFTKYLAPFPETVDLAKKLSTHYTLIGITNGSELEAKKVAEIVSPVTFQGIIYSWQVGYKKPDKQIWEHACDIAKVPPKKVVFVDDVPEYVEVWKNMGGHGICFNATKQPITDLVQELNALGVVTEPHTGKEFYVRPRTS